MKHDGAVLIVEDDPEVRASLAALVEIEGYRVLEAETGRQALDVCRSSSVCLILLDIFMPVMNGWAFLDERDKDPQLSDLPVVVITADSSAADSASKRAVVDALTKPVDHDRLLKLIEQHC